MEENGHPIAVLRKKFMSDRRVVCTGNPDRPFTLASGFRKLFPDAVFLCRATGWDFQSFDEEQQQALKKIFGKCNTFLNCSYIAPGVQSKLLEICNQSMKFCDVVNIGSTHEFDNLGQESYRLSKLELRNQSLKYNTFRFKTCHLILGGIKNNDSEEKKQWLDIDLICKSTVEIWNRSYHIPMMVIDQYKEPW
jgi:hypothetical protein